MCVTTPSVGTRANIYATIYQKNTKGREVKHIHNITTLLLTITLALYAVDENISVPTVTVGTKSAGNEANVTRSVEVINVTPTLSSLSLESNATTVNVGETVQLSVVGTYSDNSTNIVDENITYIISPVENAEVNGSVLTALKDGNVTVQAKVGTTLSNKVHLNITWVVDGHTLPPEPDPAVNNATLLGIDSNNNGVRDDVERYIYERFGKDPDYPKTKIGIAMQYGEAYQFIIGNDPQNAFENKSYEKEDYALDCLGYVIDKGIRKNSLRGVEITKYILKQKVYDNEFREKVWNTKLRLKAYFYYNSSLSGHILSGGGVLSSTKDKCNFDIDSLGEL